MMMIKTNLERHIFKCNVIKESQFYPLQGSPEAEDGVSSVRQEILRPQTAHQTGARGQKGEQSTIVS